jgi:hypothetical protein
MAALSSLNAYGSDSEGEEEEEAGAAPTGTEVRAALAAALPTPQGAGSAARGIEPDEKRPRRTFQLPLHAPKHSAPAAAKSDDESSDDEDAKRFASSRKGVGLLASVSLPVPCRLRLRWWRVTVLLGRCPDVDLAWRTAQSGQPHGAGRHRGTSGLIAFRGIRACSSLRQRTRQRKRATKTRRPQRRMTMRSRERKTQSTWRQRYLRSSCRPGAQRPASSRSGSVVLMQVAGMRHRHHTRASTTLSRRRLPGPAEAPVTRQSPQGKQKVRLEACRRA